MTMNPGNRVVNMTDRSRLFEALRTRFGEEFPDVGMPEEIDRLALLADHRTQRSFSDQKLTPETIRLICACALSAPSKSDLQQSDIVVADDPLLRNRIADLMPGTPWIRKAPAFVIVCLNGRRLPAIADICGKPFPNDHLDLFFNAATDAAIVLGWLQASVDLCGLGGCPISEIRNHAAAISEMLDLPERVVPYAGFCFGVPERKASITQRLPLSVTLHSNRYDEACFREALSAYDARRGPAMRQRNVDSWGISPNYGWAEDKARQYAVPQRTDFGRFVTSKKFNLT